MMNPDDKGLLVDNLSPNSGPKKFGAPAYYEEGIRLWSCELEYAGIKELHDYLDTVEKIVKKPGCSQHLLEVALTSMSVVTRALSFMSSKPETPRAAL